MLLNCSRALRYGHARLSASLRSLHYFDESHGSPDAIANGAQELDMVLNVGALVEGDYAAVLSDIKAVRDAAPGVVLKVILETGLLTKEHIVRGSILVKMAGADFVKTSTGFGPGEQP